MGQTSLLPRRSRVRDAAAAAFHAPPRPADPLLEGRRPGPPPTSLRREHLGLGWPLLIGAPLSPRLRGQHSSLKVVNEPVLAFTPGSPERDALQKALRDLKGRTEAIPCVVGDEEVWTSDVHYQVSPFNHGHKVAKFCYADKALLNKAIGAALAARKEWDLKPVADRAQIFLRAADMLSGPRRAEVLAKTMVGQGKTVIQAEIDAAAELIDFFRFNAKFAMELEGEQPISVPPSTNSVVYRGLEGFVAAISPFNFTAIGGNLAGAPALMGNVVLWKPSDTAMLASYAVYRVLREAGLPPNVIQFVPADGPTFGDAITNSEHLCGINFTGSVPTFKHLWKQVAQNLDRFRTFPRLAGGKDPLPPLPCGPRGPPPPQSSRQTEGVMQPLRELRRGLVGTVTQKEPEPLGPAVWVLRLLALSLLREHVASPSAVLLCSAFEWEWERVVVRPEQDKTVGSEPPGRAGTVRQWSGCGPPCELALNHRPAPAECGGKNFHFVHSSADVDSVVSGTLRSAFEYGGQKCSACSRLYAPSSLWPQIRGRLLEEHSRIKVGDPAEDFGTFFSAVIDAKRWALQGGHGGAAPPGTASGLCDTVLPAYQSFGRIKRWLEHARSSPSLSVLAGGRCDDSVGYFVEPCIIESKDPQDPIMKEEIFGPVLTVYVYPDDKYRETLRLVDSTTSYGLTGAVFAQDKDVVREATKMLRHAAGNFYINDKSTGSVVGQQPFGGARASGTNDKPGGPHYVLRWTSPQVIKETHQPLGDWRYAYMQ
ncbi:Delta-1-pyrroline-5-carboxylate dehydrogenase, mitochondrial [Galemys pyrenaicus]|uniref:Delta-1-pyrroline-5-carboxylate dehydrogenase, mitochondrial n=1 Tax=Galemys pyrenaicus TaxID=202257 RepID=A0A8J5ZL50_GALPY|nr:Delta-1-pyrroline-5-carboxylate dehydrogenase, mitochondrial [Galemys pyrenaicus]